MVEAVRPVVVDLTTIDVAGQSCYVKNGSMMVGSRSY